MTLKLLQREISKSIENVGPKSTGGFLNYKAAKNRLSHVEKRYLQVLYHFTPEGRKADLEARSQTPSVER